MPAVFVTPPRGDRGECEKADGGEREAGGQ